jgi:hypothetical protein
MAMMMQKSGVQSSRVVAGSRRAFSVARPARHVAKAASSSELGFKMMRDGIKEASDETLLTPRL